MEQFSLDKYLENPSRKVMTRSGHNIRILCTDQRGNMPIVALVEFETLDGVQIFYSDGKNESHREYDLFFADEEELTEFEKAVRNILARYISNIDCFPETIKDEAKSLLDLARKELQPEIDKEIDKAYKNIDTIVYDNGYKQGQYEIMEDLPKWKDVSGKNGAGTKDYKIVGYYLVKGNYAIYLEDLEKLPKE